MSTRKEEQIADLKAMLDRAGEKIDRLIAEREELGTWKEALSAIAGALWLYYDLWAERVREGTFDEQEFLETYHVVNAKCLSMLEATLDFD